MTDINEHIKAIFIKDVAIKNIDKQMEELRTHREDFKKVIKEYLQNPDVKVFIDQKLIEADEKFGLNKSKNKSKERSFETRTKWSSSEMGTQEDIRLEMNPCGWFIPSEDKYEITKVEQRGTNEYKITVENIKGRQYIGGFNWIMDEYYTDWFELELCT